MTSTPFFRAVARAAAVLILVCLPLTDAAFAQRGGGGRGGGGDGGDAGRGGQAPAGRQPAVFDFIVLGADGRPVTDLTTGDVEFRVGGRERELSSLTYVSVPTGEAPLPYASSQIDTSRAFFLIFEEASIDTDGERTMRSAVDAFIATLKPTDRVGLATLPAGAVVLAPTADRDAIREGLATISGRSAASLGTAPAGAQLTSTAEDGAAAAGGGARGGGPAAASQPNAPSIGGLGSESRALCRTHDSLTNLRGHLMGLPTLGGFTGVIVFSGGMSAAGLPAPQLNAVQADQACEVTGQLYDDVRAAVDARNLHLRVAQPVGTVGTQRSQGLQAFADAAGAGDVLLLAPNSSALTDLTAAWSGYYVATFVPQGSERNDERRRVEIDVSRPNVTVDARATLVVGPVAPVVAAPSMLAVPDAFRELPLRATAVPTRLSTDQPDQIKLLVIASPGEGTTLASAAVGLVAANSRLNAVGVSPDLLAARPMVVAMETPPGPYRLRFAGVDGAGLGGAADALVNAQLTQVGPFRFSGVLLGANRGGAFTPQLDFTDEPVALAYAELYGNLSGTGLNVLYELAEVPDGPALKEITPGGQATSEPDKAIIVGEIPLADLAPGDYVVRLVVEVQGLPQQGILMRTLRKNP